MTYAWESMAREDIIDAMEWSQQDEPLYPFEPQMKYEATAKGNIIASFEGITGKMQYAQIILIAQELTEEEYEAIEWGSDG